MTIHFSKIHDLTHPICEDMPFWPGDPRTKITPHSTVARDGYRLGQLTIGEHTGTHIGAPFHFYESGQCVDQIPVDRLVAPAVILNIEEQTQTDRDYLLSYQNVRDWESRFGHIENACVVLVQTGWSRFWQTVEYFGDKNGSLHFPGVSFEAADFLVQQRHIIGLGIDTAGVDGGQSADFSVNRLLAANDVYHLENLNLHDLTAPKLTICIGALPIQNGSGSPCRVVGLE